jgi:hypothetical protein
VTAPWPHGDPREVIRRIVAEPHYQRAPQHAGEKSWLDYLGDGLHRLWQMLIAPLRSLTGNGTVSEIIGLLVLAAVVVVLAVLIVRVVRQVRRRDARRHAVAPSALGAGADARTLLARALEAAAAGRHHDAAALLWASALHALDERGRVRYDPARTPGEWRRVVGEPGFDALARDAVTALFGERGADAELVARMRASYDRVVTA